MQISTYIEQIIELIVQKLENKRQCTPKVIWNLCVAISKIIQTYNTLLGNSVAFTFHDYQRHYMKRIFNFETTKSFLTIFMEGQNYKTKIHACQTLMKYVNLNQYGYVDHNDTVNNQENLLKIFWLHIQE